jgi:CARDB protein
MPMFPALRRLFGSTVKPQTAECCRQRPRATLAVEELEDRSMMSVDLLGSYLSARFDTFSPGDTVATQWRVANQGFDTAFSGFNVDFYLSQDRFISTSDRFIRSWYLPAGFPGFYEIPTVYDSVPLPAATDAFWDHSGAYYIGMIVDSGNTVFEGNEFNNSNSYFLGTDVAQINVNVSVSQSQGDIDLTQLPPSGIGPGKLVFYFYSQAKKALDSFNADVKSMQTDLKGIVDLTPTTNLMTTVSTDLGNLAKLADTVRTSKSHSVNLGAAGKLDNTQLELADRFLELMLNTSFGANTAAPLSAAPLAAHSTMVAAPDGPSESKTSPTMPGPTRAKCSGQSALSWRLGPPP